LDDGQLRVLDVFWLGMCTAYKDIKMWFWRDRIRGWKVLLLYGSCSFVTDGVFLYF
jgi:hypothetical protein